MSLLLFVHITSAIVTLTICLISLVRPSNNLRTILTLGTVASLSTGILVSLDSFNLLTCAKLAIYLSMIIITYVRLNRSIPNLEI